MNRNPFHSAYLWAGLLCAGCTSGNWLVFGILTTAGTAAIAAEPGPACAPVMRAMAKTLAADHSAVTQAGDHSSTGITASGVNYMQIGGKWMLSPLSPQDNQKRSDENLRNAKVYTCQAMPDSTLDGVAVANYRMHTESTDAVVESTLAIAKSTGLALLVENVIDMGGGTKNHYSTRYSYTGIHAPAVQGSK
jgi:hypothetical protein